MIASRRIFILPPFFPEDLSDHPTIAIIASDHGSDATGIDPDSLVLTLEGGD